MRLHGNRFVGVVLTNIIIHLINCQRLPILHNIDIGAITGNQYKHLARVITSGNSKPDAYLNRLIF